MDWPLIATFVSVFCCLVMLITASKAAWMEQECREHRRMASMMAWRARCHHYQAQRHVETVRMYAGRMTGEKQNH